MLMAAARVGCAGNGGKLGGGEVPSLRDDNVVERFVGFAKASEADFEDHCLSTLLLEEELGVSMGDILVGLRLHLELLWD